MRGRRVLACLAAADAAGGGAVAATAGSAPPPRPVALTSLGTHDTGMADRSGDVTAGGTAALARDRGRATSSRPSPWAPEHLPHRRAGRGRGVPRDLRVRRPRAPGRRSRGESPVNASLVLVANEVSRTVIIYEVTGPA